MNIVVFGAGAIGSLFGGLLSENNNVMLIGRKSHVKAIQSNDLKIFGKTNKIVHVLADYTIENVPFDIDILILTVKAFDTETAIKEASSCISKSTVVLSLQNGLDNIDKIAGVVTRKNIIAGVTTHGAHFSKPGVIEHTGIGWTILGELDGRISSRLKHIVSVFNDAGFTTQHSNNIQDILWSKAIINSSINPLTAYFRIKNGYLLENPFLEGILERICHESTAIANAKGIKLSFDEVLEKTEQVVCDTAKNYSSMLQSINKGSKTEIEAINGYLVHVGKELGVSVFLNEMLLNLFQKRT